MEEDGNIRNIHGRICPIESADKLTNMSGCIQDETYFTVLFADDSDIKSCYPFLLFEYGRAPPSIEPQNPPHLLRQQEEWAYRADKEVIHYVSRVT